MDRIISDAAISRRAYWVQEIQNLSGNFAGDYSRLEAELKTELTSSGVAGLRDHLRLCGSIPESYGHDSSEEKLYSKYTDFLLSMAYQGMGFTSLVLEERGDSADVEAVSRNYSFVADAKAFRLSRTAKNQKDFKVEAMHGWKRGKPNAMVVCPIYQLPRSASQIYQSAIVRDVAVLTYSHLSLLLAFAETDGPERAQDLIHVIFRTIPALIPSKSATDYWLAVNRTMLAYSPDIAALWETEKLASVESVEIAKEEDLTYLAGERERIMRLDHQSALTELLRISKIDSKIATIRGLRDNGLFGIV
jgi:hypothetical protein